MFTFCSSVRADDFFVPHKKMKSIYHNSDPLQTLHSKQISCIFYVQKTTSIIGDIIQHAFYRKRKVYF